MLNKKLMILTIFIVSLLAVSSVSAAENATDDIISADTGNEVVSFEETTNEVVSVDNDNQVITEGNNSDVGSFADLETEINNVEEGGVLNLTKDYVYSNEEYDISIDKCITIDGNGHYIDGLSVFTVFTINAHNVVLKNIIFKNCCYHYDVNNIDYGDADGSRDSMAGAILKMRRIRIRYAASEPPFLKRSVKESARSSRLPWPAAAARRRKDTACLAAAAGR